MITAEQIYGGNYYHWHTDYPLDTIYDSLTDFFDELEEGINVLDAFDNKCVVLVEGNKYLITITGDGDFYSHVAYIQFMEG